MAIDFPNTPTTNQIYTVGSRSWKWDGTIWAIYSNNPVLYRQDSPPSSPQEGDQWFETDTGRMFVYYGTAWVELGNATDVAGALQPSQVTALSAVTTLTSDDVFPVVDGPSGAVASSKITYGNLVTNMSNSLIPSWQTWTPVITASSGSITSYTTTTPRYTMINKTVVGQIIFAITNVGTATGVPIFTLPVTAAGSVSNVTFGFYRESQSTGLSGVVALNTTTTALLYRYDNANHIATSRTYSCSFTYEAA